MKKGSEDFTIKMYPLYSICTLYTLFLNISVFTGLMLASSFFEGGGGGGVGC